MGTRRDPARQRTCESAAAFQANISFTVGRRRKQVNRSVLLRTAVRTNHHTDLVTKPHRKILQIQPGGDGPRLDPR